MWMHRHGTELPSISTSRNDADSRSSAAVDVASAGRAGTVGVAVEAAAGMTTTTLLAPPPPRRAWWESGPWWSATVVQSASALAWTIGFALFFGAWYWVERSVLALPQDSRLVRSVIVVPMIALGVPHVLIGFLFLATSRRTRAPLARLHLALLVVAGLALCWAYTAASASLLAHNLPRVAVALYFVVHQLRDEPFFYGAHRDAPAGHAPDRTRRFLSVCTWTLVVTLTGIAIFLYDLYAHGKRPARMGPLDLVLPETLGAWGRGVLVFGVVAALVGGRWWAWSRAEPGGMIAALRRHAPIAIVYWLFLNIVLAGVLSVGVLEAIVLWHVLEWFLFGAKQAGLAEARAAAAPAGSRAPRGWLARVKGTRSGFLTLHLALSAAVFAVMLVWAYAHHRSGPLGAVASPAAFYYWTILHVTVSFFPRGGPA
jgi:hypothetical protein